MVKGTLERYIELEQEIASAEQGAPTMALQNKQKQIEQLEKKIAEQSTIVEEREQATYVYNSKYPFACASSLRRNSRVTSCKTSHFHCVTFRPNVAISSSHELTSHCYYSLLHTYVLHLGRRKQLLIIELLIDIYNLRCVTFILETITSEG